jgi:undecaprenyl phosphate N,N'-diacetylbacillosamine 1-phosphate transferase
VGKKLEFDLEYINNVTFFNDMKIILLTIGKVFKREGVCADGMETAEDYGDYLLRMSKISHIEYNEAVEKSKKLLA